MLTRGASPHSPERRSSAVPPPPAGRRALPDRGAVQRSQLLAMASRRTQDEAASRALALQLAREEARSPVERGRKGGSKAEAIDLCTPEED